MICQTTQIVLDVNSPKGFIKIASFHKNDKLTLKLQLRFKSERKNVFNDETNKISLGSEDNKTMQSIDSIET